MKGFSLLILLFLIAVPSSVAAPPAIITNTFTSVIKWLWSPESAPANSDKNIPEFEKGYVVETVLEGNKVGIKPYAIQLSPDGEILILDSADSNIFQLTPPLSRYSRATLVAGSSNGYSGYVDGSSADALFNHPKGFTVDDGGNVYVADTMNLAIRKIGESGVTTIAGGRAKRTGHVDGPSEDAKFSNDFDVQYVSGMCSLLIVDRGNQAIREIQLHSHDCGYTYATQLSSGILSIAGAVSFGYLVGMLQQGMGSLIFSRRRRPKRSYNEKTHGHAKSSKSQVVSDRGKPELVDSTGMSFSKMILGLLTFLLEVISGSFSYIFDFNSRKRKNEEKWPLRDGFDMTDEDIGANPMYGNYQNGGDYWQPKDARNYPMYKNYNKNVDSWPSRDTYKAPEDNSKHSSVPPNKNYDNHTRKTVSSKYTPNRQAHSVRVNRSFLSSRETMEDPYNRRNPSSGHRNHAQYLRHEGLAPETYYEEFSHSKHEVVFGVEYANIFDF